MKHPDLGQVPRVVADGDLFADVRGQRQGTGTAVPRHVVPEGRLGQVKVDAYITCRTTVTLPTKPSRCRRNRVGVAGHGVIGEMALQDAAQPPPWHRDAKLELVLDLA